MPSIVETLREAHRLRKLIRDLQEQIAEGPSLLSAEQDRLDRAEKDVADAKAALQQLKLDVRDKESTLKTTHQQLAKYEKQRETAASKKELDAFDHEIKHNREKASQFEDEILNGLGEIDERTANIPVLEKELAKVRQESAGFQKEADERIARLHAELERAQGELAEGEKNLPPEVRQTYSRLVASHGPDAMAKVENRICQACYASLTMQTIRELEGGGRFVTCTICGRALYV
jgi:predicted  nucleic acid-binding Zn-ribbon protein